ncbi:hypothetical protein [Lacticaseibacillus pantheris]|uniref:hypothetical protein n=1 Tax=Lacticaseibacillus pantheris TaxID=171523 RepID=UPI0006D0EC3C|nr:hypothetical protein [Lacticaseibacillus pantheris]
MLDDSAAFLDDSEADFFDAFLAANRREERLAALMDSDFFLAAFFFDAAIADLLFFCSLCSLLCVCWILFSGDSNSNEKRKRYCEHNKCVFLRTFIPKNAVEHS